MCSLRSLIDIQISSDQTELKQSFFNFKYYTFVYINMGSSRQSDGPLVRHPISPTTHQSDSPLVRQPINARGISSLINIIQCIPTHHEGGSYIHVPYITERRPYMSTHPVFLRVTSLMNLPKCVLSPKIFQSPDGFLEFGK